MGYSSFTVSIPMIRRSWLRQVTRQYLISSSLHHEFQKSLMISWKASQNLEAVVLMTMVYYSERMHNKMSRGKDTLAESGGIHPQDLECPPFWGMTQGMCSVLQQLNVWTHLQCFCLGKPAITSVQGFCWELVIVTFCLCDQPQK